VQENDKPGKGDKMTSFHKSKYSKSSSSSSKKSSGTTSYKDSKYYKGLSSSGSSNSSGATIVSKETGEEVERMQQ